MFNVAKFPDVLHVSILAHLVSGCILCLDEVGLLLLIRLAGSTTHIPQHGEVPCA